jgi:glycosyltransferase involved in cell wall biosynthesis
MSAHLQDVTKTADPLAALMGSGDVPMALPTPMASASADLDRAVRTVGSSRVASLSVVIPARNESLNLGGLLQELQAVLKTLPLSFVEILVVDDGSTDETGAIARQHGARVCRHAEGLGNGAAVKRGIRESRGDWILLLDGDGQHPPASIPQLVADAERYDMVVASRGGSGGAIHRNIVNRIYNRFASYVSNTKIPDLTSGFRLLRADVAKDLVHLLPNTFSYPTTITMTMLKAGYAVGFAPFQVRQRKGKSHVRLVADGSRFFLIILRIATFYAPLRVFVPVSALVAALGLGWYLYTWLTEGRFTNMGLLLIGQATMLFALGLISEQIAALRNQRMGHRENG